MELLPTIKSRLGIYYDDPIKDAEILSMINAATQTLRSSGISRGALKTPLAIDTIIIYIKMALSTEPKDSVINPLIISNIIQLRGLTMIDDMQREYIKNNVNLEIDVNTLVNNISVKLAEMVTDILNSELPNTINATIDKTIDMVNEIQST